MLPKQFGYYWFVYLLVYVLIMQVSKGKEIWFNPWCLQTKRNYSNKELLLGILFTRSFIFLSARTVHETVNLYVNSFLFGNPMSLLSILYIL